MKIGDAVAVRFNDYISGTIYSGTHEVVKVNTYTFWIKLNKRTIIKRHRRKHLI